MRRQEGNDRAWRRQRHDQGLRRGDQVPSSNEDLEGSAKADTLIGNSGVNSFFGQPGADVFLGKGGKDFIDATDGARDKVINCGPGGGEDSPTDRSDPKPISC